MTVAATTDITLAAFNLFPDIVALMFWSGPKTWRDNCLLTRCHDG